MFSISKSISTVAGTLVLGLAMAPAAQAVTQDQTFEWSGGDSCQLSLPTTDTMVRPRASGYRNEGTTTQFVLCGLGGYKSASFLSYSLIFTSVDGAAHDISCTAVGGLTGFSGPYYSTKTITIPGSGYTYLTWSATDFGDTAGSPISYAKSINASVTCSLPAKAAIQAFETANRINVGA
ncbi:MAG: hypothetical protein QM719_07420 [Thermomonas sp.]